MTDNEIIKILIDYGTQCKPYVISAAINLINRQQAEIEKSNERLRNKKHALFEQQSYTAELQQENMELKAINESLKADKPFIVANTKSEAIKEFAERLNVEEYKREKYIKHIHHFLQNLKRQDISYEQAVEISKIFNIFDKRGKE